MIQSAVNDLLLPIYARTGRWAERTNALLKSFYGGRGGYYIDVGANIGLTTIPIAQDPHVTCLAIEPHPVNYANLTANVARNCPQGNVELRQMAVFSRHERLRFEVSPVNSGDHRIRRSDDPGRLGEGKWPTIDITAAPLDAIGPAAARRWP